MRVLCYSASFGSFAHNLLCGSANHKANKEP